MKYTYFNLKGRGECPRLCFAAAGIKYEDKRVEFSEWKDLKAKTPTGQLPYLETDGKFITQSMAIARFVARKGGLMGSNDIEAAQIDAVSDTVLDLREKAFAGFQKPEAEKAAHMKEFAEKTLAATLPTLEKVAAANKAKPGFFIGSKISLADIHFFSIFEILMAQQPNMLDAFPALKKVKETVAANPGIAAYLKKRPETPF